MNFINSYDVAKTRYTDLFKDDPVYDAIIKTICEVTDYYQKETIDLFTTVFNIDKQKGYGLDIIGNIINQPRLLADFNQGIHFGFEGSYKSGTFGTVTNPSVGSPFYSLLSVDQGSGRILNDEEYKRVLKAKVISRSSTCSTTDLIKIVRLLSNSELNSISTQTHGVIQLTIEEDTDGLLSYFISRMRTQDNIIPIAAGYRLEQNYV